MKHIKCVNVKNVFEIISHHAFGCFVNSMNFRSFCTITESGICTNILLQVAKVNIQISVPFYQVKPASHITYICFTNTHNLLQYSTVQFVIH